MLAISPPFNTFNEPKVYVEGRGYVTPEHRNFITDGVLFQCLDCGRWSDSLNVLNAVDCEENEALTLEELKV